MGSNKLHQDAAERVRSANDEPVLVPAEIENDPIITNEVGGRPKLSFDVIRSTPSPSPRHSKPCSDRTFGLRVALPELFERPASDHLHGEV